MYAINAYIDPQHHPNVGSYMAYMECLGHTHTHTHTHIYIYIQHIHTTLYHIVPLSRSCSRVEAQKRGFGTPVGSPAPLDQSPIWPRPSVPLHVPQLVCGLGLACNWDLTQSGMNKTPVRNITIFRKDLYYPSSSNVLGTGICPKNCNLFISNFWGKHG